MHNLVAYSWYHNGKAKAKANGLKSVLRPGVEADL